MLVWVAFSITCLQNEGASGGVKDGDLTSRGSEEAKKLAEKLRTIQIDHLYSSGLKRAFQTALPISAQNINKPPIIQNSGFNERETGERFRERVRLDKNESAGQEFFGRVSDGLPIRNHRPAGGGESCEDVALRAKSELRILLSKHGMHFKERPKQFEEKQDTASE